MGFSAVLLFAVIWFTFAYIPMAHMVWYWAGPDAPTWMPPPPGCQCHRRLSVPARRLDFAGGTVVHYQRGGSPVWSVPSWSARGLATVVIPWLPQPDHDHDWRRPALVSAGSASTPAPRWKPTARPPWPSSTPGWRRRCRALLDLWAEWMMKGRPSCWAPCPVRWRAWWAITPAAGFVGVGGASSRPAERVAGPWGVHMASSAWGR